VNANRFDPIRAIEACYAGARDDQAWLAGLARAFAPLAFDRGTVALLWELREGRVRCLSHAVLGPASIGLADALAIWASAPPSVVDGLFSALSVVDTARHVLRKLGPAYGAPLEAFAGRGIFDGLAVSARDPTGRIVQVWAMASHLVRIGPRAQHRLTRVAAHLATAARLRAVAHPVVEAVVDPGGEVLHAEGEARAPEARASLAAAVRRTERARGRMRRTDPDEALELWRGLVEGRWSLVDHVESDGSRVVLARRNPPGAPDPKALSARERDVLAYVVQGHSNKHVAYAMGLSGATIAAHLKGALSKLGVRSRGEVIGLLSGTGAGPSAPDAADSPDEELG